MKDRQAFDFDGDYGRDYDALVKRVIPAYEQIFLATVSLFERELGHDARVLVVGSGTGAEVIAFGTANPSWSITAVDPSAEMVRTATARVAALDEATQISIRQGYVHDLPRSPPFDAATVMNVLHFLEDDGSKAALLESVSARVRPGGLVAMVDLHGDPESAEFELLMDGWVKFMEHMGLRGQAREEFLERLDRGMVYVSAAREEELWRSAGFELDVQFYRAFLYGGWLLRRT
jgi:tRNA (cmo5U34)-methyltransferase